MVASRERHQLKANRYCYRYQVSVGAQNSKDTIFAISFMCSQSQKPSVRNRSLELERAEVLQGQRSTISPPQAQVSKLLLKTGGF